jgi:hypothetical protein
LDEGTSGIEVFWHYGAPRRLASAAESRASRWYSCARLVARFVPITVVGSW